MIKRKLYIKREVQDLNKSANFKFHYFGTSTLVYSIFSTALRPLVIPVCQVSHFNIDTKIRSQLSLHASKKKAFVQFYRNIHSQCRTDPKPKRIEL